MFEQQERITKRLSEWLDEKKINILLDYKHKHKDWGSFKYVFMNNNFDQESVIACLYVARKRGDKEGEKVADILLNISSKRRYTVSLL
jgi:hypothetical protein